VRSVSETPGVEDVFEHYVVDVPFREKTAQLNAGSMEVIARRVGLDLVSRIGPDSEIVRGLIEGGVIVYSGFARRFDIRLGDVIELDTPAGRRAFPVLGVRAFGGSTSDIQLDIGTFDRYWPRPGAWNLIIWTSGNERDVLDRIQKTAGSIQPLFSLTAEESERLARSTLERYSGPIDALVGLVALLGSTAVAGLLFGMSKDLGGDGALLTCMGMLRRQLFGLLLVEGLSVALGGVAVGLALSTAFVAPLGAVVREELGWTISWSARPPELGELALATAVISVLLEVLAARRISRSISWNALAPE
jgi:putative ABC transport system permease protein